MDELEIPSAIIPVAPANFSAWGMLMVDIRHNFASTLMRKLDLVSVDELNSTFDKLVRKGVDTLASEGIASEDIKVLKSMDMRYTGQEHTVSVPIDFSIDENGKAQIYEEFNRVYKEVHGYTLPQPSEVVNLRIGAIGEIPTPTLREIQAGTKQAGAALKGNRKVFGFMKRDWVKHKVYERSKLLANNMVTGPALIEEPTSVTVVSEGHHCEVDRLGNLVITRR